MMLANSCRGGFSDNCCSQQITGLNPPQLSGRVYIDCLGMWNSLVKPALTSNANELTNRSINFWASEWTGVRSQLRLPSVVRESIASLIHQAALLLHAFVFLLSIPDILMSGCHRRQNPMKGKHVLL